MGRTMSYEAMQHLQGEVAKIVATFPQVKKHRSGGHAGSNRDMSVPGKVWVMIDEFSGVMPGDTPKDRHRAILKLEADIKAAVEPFAASLPTLKLPGVRIPRGVSHYEVEVGSLAGAAAEAMGL